MNAPFGPGRVRVEWVTSEDGLEARVGGAPVARGDWDSAADIVRAYLSQLATATPNRMIRADFAHEGGDLGSVLISADGTVHDIDARSQSDGDLRDEGEGDGATDIDGARADADSRGATGIAVATEDPLASGAPDAATGMVTALRLGAADPSLGSGPSAVPWGGVAPAEPVGPGTQGDPGRRDRPTPGPARSEPEPARPHPEPARPHPEPARSKPETFRQSELARSKPEPARSKPETFRQSEPARPPRSGSRSVRPTRSRPARTGPAVARSAHQLPRPGKRLLITAGAIACVLALLLTSTMLILRSRPTITLVRDETMSTTPPAEWGARARWRTPALLRDAGRVLMIDGTQMAFVTKDRALALVVVDSAEVRWSAHYPDGKPGTDLTSVTIDGARVIAAQVGDQLAWWDLDSGDEHRLTLPGGASVNLQGSAPLVITDQGRTAATVAAGKLVTTPVPDGATPIAARTDGTITATSAAGWWHLVAGKPATNPVPWENPGTAGSPTIVAYLSDHLVTVLPASAPGTAYVAIYSDRPRDVRFAWGGAAWFDGGMADWYPSPSRRWGILGRTLVDLSTGRTVDLGAWSTQTVSSDRALGTLGKQRVLVGPQIPAGVVPDGESFPEDLALSGAAVRASTGADDVVYLLPPKASP